MRISDWSSDVCSSDLAIGVVAPPRHPDRAHQAGPPHPERPARAHASDAEAGDHRSEEHTSELQSLMRISYAVFCLKKKNKKRDQNTKYKKRNELIVKHKDTPKCAICNGSHKHKP